MLKQAHIQYILACHLQIDTDPDLDPDPAYHFDADPDPCYRTKMMWIRIHNTALKNNGLKRNISGELPIQLLLEEQWIVQRKSLILLLWA
jgi:hypothetical protein